MRNETVYLGVNTQINTRWLCFGFVFVLFRSLLPQLVSGLGSCHLSVSVGNCVPWGPESCPCDRGVAGLGLEVALDGEVQRSSLYAGRGSFL